MRVMSTFTPVCFWYVVAIARHQFSSTPQYMTSVPCADAPRPISSTALVAIAAISPAIRLRPRETFMDDPPRCLPASCRFKKMMVVYKSDRPDAPPTRSAPNTARAVTASRMVESAEAVPTSPSSTAR